MEAPLWNLASALPHRALSGIIGAILAFLVTGNSAWLLSYRHNPIFISVEEISSARSGSCYIANALFGVSMLL